MNRFFNTLAAAAGVILLTGSFAVAQTAPAHTAPPKAKAEKTGTSGRSARVAPVSGEIVKADASSVTLKTRKGEESFAVNSDTKITQAGKSMTSSDLMAGEMATVSFTKAGDQMTATRIAVRPAKKAPAASKVPKAPKK